MGDTVSNYQDCGPTPHTAEILMHNGSKVLRLTSRESQVGGCAYNVYLWIFDASTVGLPYNIKFLRVLTIYLCNLEINEETRFNMYFNAIQMQNQIIAIQITEKFS